MDPFGRGDQNGDSLFTQNVSLSGQFAQQWMLGMTAREAGLKAVAEGELRRLLSRDESFDCADAKIGVSALS